MSRDTDKDWKKYGKNDPYFGVLGEETYRSKNLDPGSRDQFFRSGERYVHFVLDVVRNNLDPAFKPACAIDFGCGVGRVTIPLAAVSDLVVGVDISDEMLSEAQKNCDERGLKNVTFLKSDDRLSRVKGPFNFAHSFIVFQHIRTNRGEQILQRLIDLLQDGGVGVLHFTYYRRANPLKQLLYDTAKSSAFLSGLWNVYKGRPYGEPTVQMNRYKLNNLFRILQENDCHQVHVRFTNHNQFYGVILFFKKAPGIENGIA